MRNRSGIGHGALHCTGVELKAEETQVAAPQEVAQSADRKAVRLNMEAEITQQARAPEIFPFRQRHQPARPSRLCPSWPSRRHRRRAATPRVIHLARPESRGRRAPLYWVLALISPPSFPSSRPEREARSGETLLRR